MEDGNMTECSIEFLESVDYSAKPMLIVVNYFDYFVCTECIWRFTPGFIEPILFTVEIIPKDVISQHCYGFGCCVKC